MGDLKGLDLTRGAKREKEMRELLESFVQDHADVDAINGRRHSNCDWCQRAKKLLWVIDDCPD